METPSTDSSQPSRARGRGRGKSRGGLGKYLRARGRGRGRGRPAEFTTRLVLEDEEEVELDPNSEEAGKAKEFQQKFSRRQLGSNADRYAEPEPVLNSDGEEEVEPEIDLSSFLEKQRLSEGSPGPSSAPPPPDEGEVDESLAHITSRSHGPFQSKKGKIQTIEWDEDLDEMTREKAAAEATWELKSRFQSKAEKLRAKPPPQPGRARKPEKVVEAPLLPIELAAQSAKDPKHEMQDFLDDLLSY